MTDLSPWLILIALGAFHGLNPAMGWLFAVALGLYRKSRSVILVSLIPIALGHALAIAVVVYAVVFLGMAIDENAFRIFSGVLLIGWGIFHLLYGHRHRVHVGLRTGLFGLAIWSFVMATAHGAGAMLIPVLMPLEHAAMLGHAGEHAEFLEQMRALASDFAQGEEDAAVASAIDLRAALAAHMNDADRRLVGHVRPPAPR